MMDDEVQLIVYATIKQASLQNCSKQQIETKRVRVTIE